MQFNNNLYCAISSYSQRKHLNAFKGSGIEDLNGVSHCPGPRCFSKENVNIREGGKTAWR